VSGGRKEGKRVGGQEEWVGGREGGREGGDIPGRFLRRIGRRCR